MLTLNRVCEVHTPFVGGVKHPSKRGKINDLGGGFKYLLFSPLFGEDFQFD